MISVFYDARMAADSLGYSPSAAKPKQVVEHWLATDQNIEVKAFKPLSTREICAAHDYDFVNGVLNCEVDNVQARKHLAKRDVFARFSIVGDTEFESVTSSMSTNSF